MKSKPNLSENQKEQLKKLEPALKNAAKLGQYQNAKKITSQIQNLLRPTGHETRLMKSKNWLFEAAMEAGELNTAASGLIGVRKKMNKRTRIYLEATALLAVCRLRQNKVDKAEPLIKEVLGNQNIIRSEHTRRKFKKNVINRFEEEVALVNLRNSGDDLLIPEEIQEEAGDLLTKETDDEFYKRIGNSVPSSVAQQILRIEIFAQKQLPEHEFKYLPDPRDKIQDRKVGETVFTSLKRVIWRALCDKDSDIYNVWFNNGMGLVLNKYYLSTAIISALTGIGIGIKAVVVSVTALIIKLGIEVYCDRYQPEGIMDARI